MSNSPSTVQVITRRQALAGLAAAALGTAILPGLSGCSSRDDPSADDESARSFWATIADEARAADPTLDLDRATAELDLDIESARTTGFDEASDDLLADLARRTSDDFASGRTSLVAGWLLARTEVLLAVVASEASA